MQEPNLPRSGFTTGTAMAEWWPELKATFALSVPLVFSQLAAIAIKATDVVMMGWLGPEFLAAGALAATLFFPFHHFGTGIVSAVMPMAAQAKGARDFRGVRRSVRQGLWVALMLGVLFAALLWYSREILIALGQNAALADLAGSYLQIVLWSFTPIFWFMVLRCLVTIHARARAIAVITLVAVGLNGLGNYALMFGNFGMPRLELVGAAISSVVVESVMCLALLIYLSWHRDFRRYNLLVRLWRADWPRFFEVLRLGMPMGLTTLAETSLFSAAGILMGWLGTAELAAHAVALQCAATAFMIPLGISLAVTARVGLAAGAGDSTGIGRAGWIGLGLGMAAMSISASIFWFAGPQLVGLFLDSNISANLPVIDLAVSFLIVAAVFQLVDGLQVVGVGALRGLKDTNIPMWFAIFGYWGVGMPLAYILGFPLAMGGEGIWGGLAAGLAVVAVLAVWRFYRRGRWVPVSVPV